MCSAFSRFSVKHRKLAVYAGWHLDEASILNTGRKEEGRKEMKEGQSEGRADPNSKIRPREYVSHMHEGKCHTEI